MKHLLMVLLGAAALSAAPATETFTGVVTDSICARTGHAQMHMGPTDADCTRACVLAHDAMYVLLSGTDVYTLSDQQAPDPLAGRTVKVTGTLDARTRTIHVESISAAD